MADLKTGAEALRDHHGGHGRGDHHHDGHDHHGDDDRADDAAIGKIIVIESGIWRILTFAYFRYGKVTNP